MYEDVLKFLGLSEPETKIYELLLKQGDLPAYKISQITKISRTNVYNLLSNLEARKIIQSKKKGAKTIYVLNHPNILLDMYRSKSQEVVAQENQIKTVGQSLNTILPQLVSQFNLVTYQPGIKVFEGAEGDQYLLDDQAAAKTEILQYSCPDPEEEKYWKRGKVKRIVNRVHKKILTSDTAITRQIYARAEKKYTTVRYLKDMSNFKTVITIYDNKVTFHNPISVKERLIFIIEDQMIYQTLRAVFLNEWEKALLS
jgi:sugar-specific transcriptional regulator TrmB